MKKFRFLPMLMALVILFTACGKSDEPALDMNTSMQLAQKHSQMLVNEDFENLTEDFDESIKGKLGAKDLAEGWKQVTDVRGSYVMPHSMDYTENKGYATVTAVLEYENTGVAITLTYTAEGKIRGIYLNMKALESDLESTEDFEEKEIAIGEYALKGILTLPKDKEEYPVVVLVQGSGASDFDETVFKLKPFREIAHYLAENGIASVRINKRFYQKPETSTANVTIYDEYMNDIYDAAQWAKDNVSEDLYIIGHSLGASSAPKIALDNGAKGVIMLAGSTRGLEDSIYDQNVLALENDNEHSEKEKAEILKTIEAEIAKVKALKDGDEQAIMGIPASYWLSLRELDTENILKNELEVPVLILQGEADFQVYYDKDFKFMQEILADKDNITFKSYEGLNHVFMPQSKPGVFGMEEYMEENHISQEVLEDIVDFILEN